jgi:hypothetical protein
MSTKSTNSLDSYPRARHSTEHGYGKISRHSCKATTGAALNVDRWILYKS